VGFSTGGRFSLRLPASWAFSLVPQKPCPHDVRKIDSRLDFQPNGALVFIDLMVWIKRTNV
jgi:hypothetical protein